MEVSLKEFINNVTNNFRLDDLKKMEVFSKPIPKINFAYSYTYYLLGFVHITKHLDHFVDNNTITVGMFDTLSNIHNSDKIALSDEQYKMYELMIKK